MLKLILFVTCHQYVSARTHFEDNRQEFCAFKLQLCIPLRMFQFENLAKSPANKQNYYII